MTNLNYDEPKLAFRPIVFTYRSNNGQASYDKIRKLISKDGFERCYENDETTIYFWVNGNNRLDAIVSVYIDGDKGPKIEVRPISKDRVSEGLETKLKKRGFNQSEVLLSAVNKNQ